jgi:DnaK suppressor protein
MPTKKAPAKKATAPVKKTTPAKKAAPAKKAPAPKKAAPEKKPVAAKKAAPEKKPAPAKKAAPEKKPAPATKAAAAPKTPEPKSTSKKSTPPMKSSATSKKTPAASAAKKAGSSLEGFGAFVPYKEKKGEEYMSDAMKDHFRDILRAWKRELMEEVDRTVHHMQDEAANFPDPNDRATQESEFTMELRTRDRERKLIKKIDEALDKLDKDEYGYCDSCGVEIGIRRLEARPTATLCIDCKTLDEIREKQMG